ncbi:ExeM/NucH family extracellular endonuclease [Reinekea thalattae]|uniref:ExeM/NucH family extracellular endonuclease n=1 Tax=Reinekea thalattae TaxID=2593301 RepID=A0A5C8Z8X4_9GAMM|nr:ExeM/NucH family extracellular endonuclease [Reinekea thalattae]TXR53300.1 ExeM/NucH family extracellular endonuclease [Reinekea thalattae]
MRYRLAFIGSAAIILASQSSANLLFSEYVEGSSYNKALELYNSGDSAVDLSNYSIELYSNGSSTASYSLTLNGSLASDSYYVISHPSANSDILAVSNVSSTVTNFNGNDAVLLKQNGTVIDRIGQLGNSATFAANVTLVRNENISEGDPDYSASFDISAQWTEYPQDTLAYLGSGSSTPSEPTVPDYLAELSIMQVQGTGESSPYIDTGSYSSADNYKVSGVVTGIETATNGDVIAPGFFIQDAQGDNDPLTSDGIYVYYYDTQQLDLNVGDEVAVYGPIKEYFGLTELAPEYVELTGNSAEIVATPLRTLASDDNFEQTLERHEGMYVLLDESADMHITRTFGFDYASYRNNMVLSKGGWNPHPNQHAVPGSSEAAAQSIANAQNRLFVESMQEAEDGSVPWYPSFAEDSDNDGSADEYLRIGAIANGMTGFIGYSYSEYRFYVEPELELSQQHFLYPDGNDRIAQLDLKEGDLRIATFNVLNYFNSKVGGAVNPNQSADDNRGTENIDDFYLQTDKIVAALIAIDADIIGLMELENNGFSDDSAIATLVNALNEQLPRKQHYRFVQPPGYDYIGTDAITNAVLYRPRELKLMNADVIKMPEQHAPSVSYDDGSFESGDNYQRDAVLATFKHPKSDKPLIIAVNHLKSKGSVCYEDVMTGSLIDDDLQGSCEAFRVSGAYYLAEQLKRMKGYKMIIGDLNAYGSEDAILLLTQKHRSDYEINAAAYTYVNNRQAESIPLHGAEGAVLRKTYGYLNLTEHFEDDAYSYSYNDEVGTLDYMLGSEDLKDIVIDAAHWNINAGESSYFQYDYSYGEVTLYGDAFRSSDHDPAIVVLEFDGKGSKPDKQQHQNQHKQK